MATASPSLDTTLEIKRTFQSSRGKVFEAWTDPEKLNRWFTPSDDYEVNAECDPRPGFDGPCVPLTRDPFGDTK